MKPWVRSLLNVTLNVLLVGAAHAGVNQWTSTNWPAGRAVFTLAIDPKTPTTVYAGTDQGVFKRVGTAGSWTVVGLRDSGVGTLAIDPQTPTIVYAGTSQGIFKSLDGGTSWRPINNGVPTGPDNRPTSVTSLYIDPRMPTTLYSPLPGAFLKTIDGGEHWFLLNPPVNGEISAFAFDPYDTRILYVGTSRVRYSGGAEIHDGQVLRSTDGGATWAQTGLRDIPIRSLAVASTTPATIYAAIDGFVLKSADQGGTWKLTNLFTISGALTADRLNPTGLYLNTGQRLLRSLDGGGSWSSINNGLVELFPDFASALSLHRRENATFLYAGDSRVPASAAVLENQFDGVPPADVVMNVESPEEEQIVSGIGMIRGWAFVTRPDVPLYRVGVVLENSLRVPGTACCSERNDVAAAFPQFPHANTLNSGWGTAFNWGALRSGAQRLQVWGDSLAKDFFAAPIRTVTVVKPGDFEFLDQFSLATAHAAINGNELLVTGVVVRDKQTQQRKQINVRFRWFANSQSFGMVQAETVSTVASRLGPLPALVATLSRWVGPHVLGPTSAEAAPGIASYWESPEEGQVASGIAIVRGWAFTQEPVPSGVGFSIRTIRFSIDGLPAGTVNCCSERPDVRQAFPTNPNAWGSGWGIQLNYGDLPLGTHTLNVQLEGWNGETQTLTRTITTIRTGGFVFVDRVDLSGATARITGEDILLSGVQVRDKVSQQTKVIEMRLRWFQHSQSLGIVAVSN